MSEKPLRAITWSKGRPAASRHRVGEGTEAGVDGGRGASGARKGREHAKHVRGAPLGGSRDAPCPVVAPERRLSRKKRGGRQTPHCGHWADKASWGSPARDTARAGGRSRNARGERDAPYGMASSVNAACSAASMRGRLVKSGSRGIVGRAAVRLELFFRRVARRKRVDENKPSLSSRRVARALRLNAHTGSMSMTDDVAADLVNALSDTGLLARKSYDS